MCIIQPTISDKSITAAYMYLHNERKGTRTHLVPDICLVMNRGWLAAAVSTGWAFSLQPARLLFSQASMTRTPGSFL